MHHTLRHDEALPRPQFDRPALQIDEESSLYYVEKFVVVIVFVQ